MNNRSLALSRVIEEKVGNTTLMEGVLNGLFCDLVETGHLELAIISLGSQLHQCECHNLVR